MVDESGIMILRRRLLGSDGVVEDILAGRSTEDDEGDTDGVGK